MAALPGGALHHARLSYAQIWSVHLHAVLGVALQADAIAVAAASCTQDTVPACTLVVLATTMPQSRFGHIS